MGDRVRVYPNGLLKPGTTISSPFIVENAGPLTVSGMHFEYFFRKVESGGPDWENVATGTLTRADLSKTRLGPDESTRATCQFLISFFKPITFADVEISVFYRYRTSSGQGTRGSGL
jgi:hypothetical protein